jgi:diacylglycerol O-acyltransferase / wax synthase
MAATRLSPMDNSFLAVESATAHMHVGWTAVFEPPSDRQRPGFTEIRRHIESRLSRAPRYRQKVSPAPLHLDAPSWVDDQDFDIERHVVAAQSRDLDAVVDDCLSRQLDRDRPLWEIHVAEQLADGRMAVVGKAHHCMVDGIAAVELASLLLDPTPEPPRDPDDDWRPEPEPTTATRLLESARQKAQAPFELARATAGLLGSPPGPGTLARGAGRATGVASRALQPSRLVRPLNQRISARRHQARLERPLADLQEVKRGFGTTLNDVYLAAASGAVRRLLIQRGQDPIPLKTMVPVNVREDGEQEELGNRISFMFVELPCQEPDPGIRLNRVHEQTTQGKQGGDPVAGDAALRLAGYAPRPIQQLVSRMMASPRMFNLVVSNIPGPREPMFMLGCELKEAYPVVPLADRHTLSIGMTTIRDRACFGLYAGGQCIADVDQVADGLDRSTDELLAI